ncbi:MAG: hypothetical protein LKF71_03085 [Oscillospiraceae bacterium]|jgi:hypothetical protein|nr:hypothetical protein [Oscillospiraceae bacterium]
MKSKSAFFRYEFLNCLKIFGIVILIVAALNIFSIIFFSTHKEVGNFNGYGFMSFVFMFVLGILATRNYIRLGSQFGFSRRTAFFSSILCYLLVSTVVAVSGILLQLLMGNANSSINYADLYQSVYRDSLQTMQLSAAQNLTSGLLNLLLAFSCSIYGVFFAILFWIISRKFLAIAIAAVVLLINLSGSLLVRYQVGVILLHWITASPVNLMLLFLIPAAVCGVISWFLLRHVAIKGSSK